MASIHADVEAGHHARRYLRVGVRTPGETLTLPLCANSSHGGANQKTRSGVEINVVTSVDELATLSRVSGPRAGKATLDALEFMQQAKPHLLTMLRLARRLGRHDAEDIVQEALARAWEKRAQYDSRRGSFGAWLLAITADRAYKSWRWSLRHNQPLAVGVADAPLSDQMVDLERSIQRLPVRQRLAVNCYYFAGLSVAETAAVMRCSEGTVKSTLSDARHALREQLR